MESYGAWAVARRIRLCRRATGAAGGAKGATCLVSWCGGFRATTLSPSGGDPIGPLAQSEKLRGFGGRAPTERGVGRAVCRSKPCEKAGSYVVVLMVAWFPGTGCQAVAAAVDGNDLGAVQQAVEDGSGRGNVP